MCSFVSECTELKLKGILKRLKGTFYLGMLRHSERRIFPSVFFIVTAYPKRRECIDRSPCYAFVNSAPTLVLCVRPPKAISMYARLLRMQMSLM